MPITFFNLDEIQISSVFEFEHMKLLKSSVSFIVSSYQGSYRRLTPLVKFHCELYHTVQAMPMTAAVKCLLGKLCNVLVIIVGAMQSGLLRGRHASSSCYALSFVRLYCVHL